MRTTISKTATSNFRKWMTKFHLKTNIYRLLFVVNEIGEKRQFLWKSISYLNVCFLTGVTKLSSSTKRPMYPVGLSYESEFKIQNWSHQQEVKIFKIKTIFQINTVFVYVLAYILLITNFKYLRRSCLLFLCLYSTFVTKVPAKYSNKT